VYLSPHGGASPVRRSPRRVAGPNLPTLPRLALLPEALPAVQAADREVAKALAFRTQERWSSGLAAAEQGGALDDAVGADPWMQTTQILPRVRVLPDRASAGLNWMGATFRESFWDPRSADKVIWRGEHAELDMARKTESDLEFARFRRSTQMEWSHKHRQQAREGKLRRERMRLKALEQANAERCREATPDEEDAKSEQHVGDVVEMKEDFSHMVSNFFQGVAAATSSRGSQSGEAGSHTAHDDAEDAGGGAPPARSKSLIARLGHKTERASRIGAIQELSKSKRRFARLLNVRKRQFEDKPATEQQRLLEAYQQADRNNSCALDSVELRRALASLGMVAKTKIEEKEFNAICEELMVIGDVDFMVFCFEAVPRLRQKLLELRRASLRQRFDMYDLDRSGALSVEECNMILERICSGNMDTKGLEEMRCAFKEALADAIDPVTEEVRFDKFETLVAQVQEQSQRIRRDREQEVLAVEEINEWEMSDHQNEMLILYDTFVRANLSGTGKLDRRELRLLLIEMRLLPHGPAEKEVLDDCMPPIAGSYSAASHLNFRECLRSIRLLRESVREQSSQELHMLFERTDRDRSGQLSQQEVFGLIATLGLSPQCREDQCEMQQLLADIDTDGSGEFDYYEFETLVQRLMDQVRTMENMQERKAAEDLGFKVADFLELREVYFLLDAVGTSKVTFEPLLWLTARLKLPLDRVQVEEMYNEVCEYGEGLDFVQFLKFLKLVQADVTCVKCICAS